MKLTPRGAAAGALGLTAAAAIAVAPALAADPSLQRANAKFPERAFTLDLGFTIALDSKSVDVRENGDPVSDLTVVSAEQGAANDFGTVLVIDTSGSVKGEPIIEAMKAARAFAAQRAPEQQLAVITFSNSVTERLGFTTDESEIDSGLATEPATGGGTHLYDAVAAAIHDLEDAGIGAGSIVVLSDGADTVSATDLNQVVALAGGAGVQIYSVGLAAPDLDREKLETLAVGGAYADAASPEDLRGIFSALGSQLASQYLLRYTSDAGLGQPVTVEVKVDGVPGTAGANYTTPHALPSSGGSDFWDSTATMIVTACLVALLIGLSLFVIVRPRPESVRERLSRFIGGTGAADVASDATAAAPQGALFAGIERSFEQRDWWQRLIEELEIAEIETAPMRIVAGAVLGTMFAMFLIGGVTGFPILAPLGLLVLLGVRMAINRRLRQRRGLFADQLADNLQVVASAIRAGNSMVGAFSVMVDEADEPAKTEFRRIVNDERLGVPLEDAVRDVARRMDNRDVDQVALVATIQRETGGNTAEVLDRVIETIRERGELRRLMETLTAQGRLSQVVVTALPPVLLVAISLINPSYADPLFNTTTGNILLIAAACLVVAGSLVIRRIVDVKV